MPKFWSAKAEDLIMLCGRFSTKEEVVEGAEEVDGKDKSDEKDDEEGVLSECEMAVNWKMLAALALVVGLVVLVFSCLLYSLTGGEIPFDHGVIIDAGSSHSEAILYKWKGDKFRGTGEIVQIDNCESEPGISSYPDPAMAGESLLQCLNQLAEYVDKEKRSQVPVYLGATAGMRLLNETNQYQSMATFTAVKCAIPKSSMSVRDVGIITGQDEGLYAWISTNYILGTIQRKEHPTKGAADMGGASTQISFEVTEPQPNNPNVVSLQLYGEKYHVYSITYLCYGSFEIYRRYLASLIEDNLEGEETTVDNPCGNEGQELKFTGSFLLDQPCTKTRKVAIYVFLNPDKMNTTYTFMGTADTDRCREIVKSLFDPDVCKQKHKECFAPIDPLARPEEFMAFSSYYWTMDFMNSKNKSLKQFRENVEKFCTTPYKNIDFDKYPKSAQAVIPRYCFQGIMVDTILTDGYGFNETTWGKIQFARKVNGKSVGWALGYMTNATNAIPEEDPTAPVIGVAGFAVLLVVSLALLALGLFMCTRAKRKNKHVAASQVP